jgi:hypothetical protein
MRAIDSLWKSVVFCAAMTGVCLAVALAAAVIHALG